MDSRTVDAPFRPFALKRPCGNSPFRADRTPFLDRDRAQEIAASLHADSSFHCHQTVSYESEDGAGAVITMEREGFANQMMRIAERLGFYNPADLAKDAPVHDSLAAWVPY